VSVAVRAPVEGRFGEVLTDRAPWSAILQRTESDEPYDTRLWQTLSRDVGVAGLPVPEKFGGAGASWREAAVAAEELGRAVAPVPNLDVSTVDWSGRRAHGYAGELIATLEARGYYDFGAGIEVSHVVTPADWADVGMAAGTPFAAAHTLRQTGPFRPGNLHPRLSNVVFTGSGTQPGVGVPMVLISGKLAAQRVTG